MKIIQTPEFRDWFDEQITFIQMRIMLRMDKLEYEDHFGDFKYLGDKLSELRWKNGLRVYFSRPYENLVLFLIGGNKNEQKKNIKKARIFISRHANYWVEEHKRVKQDRLS